MVAIRASGEWIRATLKELATFTLKRHAAWDMLSDCGEMAERTKAPVSKTGIPPGIVGSNPTLSAKFEAKFTVFNG